MKYPFHITKQNVPKAKILTKDEMIEFSRLPVTSNIGHIGKGHISKLIYTDPELLLALGLDFSTPYIDRINKLCSYADYLKSNDAIVKHYYCNTSKRERIEMQQKTTIFSDKFISFVHAAQSCFYLHNEIDVINEAFPNLYKKRFFDSKKKMLARLKAAIGMADSKTLAAMFTDYLRNGNWEVCQTYGIYAVLVDRLIELKPSGCFNDNWYLEY